MNLQNGIIRYTDYTATHNTISQELVRPPSRSLFFVDSLETMEVHSFDRYEFAISSLSLAIARPGSRCLGHAFVQLRMPWHR